MHKKHDLGEPEDFVSIPSVIRSNMTGAASGVFDPGKLALEELGEVNWGELHSYMVRRFGPSNVGCDPYKEIARWIITTPMEGLHLSVTIAPNSTELLFGYIMTREKGELFYRDQGVMRQAKSNRFVAWCMETHGRLAPSWELHETGVDATYEERSAAQAITSKWYDAFDSQDKEPEREPNEYDRGEAALRRTLRDLRRSVGVRDQDISALGIVEGGDDSVGVYANAGMAPPPLAFTERMWSIYGAIMRLGGGEEGLTRLVEIVEREVPKGGPDAASA